MDRQELADVLRHGYEAVTLHPLSPAFGAVFFDGRVATSYDGELAVISPCSLPVAGGVDGRMLKNWVLSCSGSDVKVDESSTEVVFKCGRSTLRLPKLDPTQLVFELPAGSGVALTDVEELLGMMAKALPFVGADDAHLWRVGMTMDVDDVATLYATDNVSMISCSAVVDSEGPTQTVLPARFVKALLAQVKRSSLAAIEIGDGWVLGVFDDGRLLFAQTGVEFGADQYLEVLGSCTHGVACWRPVTEELGEALNRVAVTLKILGSDECQLSVTEDGLTITTDPENMAVAREEVPFVLDEDVEMWVYVQELLRVLEDGELITIQPQFVVVTGEGFTAVVSAAVADEDD